MPYPATSLEKYVRDSEMLIDDIDSVLEEFDYKQKYGGQVHYSIDSSEVYSFLFPFAEDDPLNFIFGHVGDRFDEYADFCLAEILIQRKIERVVTEAHLAEIDAHYERVQLELYRWDAYSDIEEVYERAKKEASLFRLEESGRISIRDDSAVGDDERGGNWTEVPDHQVLSKIRELAPTIYLIIVKDEMSPVSRRRTLIREFKPRNIRAFVPRPANLECRKYFGDLLSRTRPGKYTQNRMDSAALEQIVSANLWNRHKGKIFRLVTRDRHISLAAKTFIKQHGYERFYGSRGGESFDRLGFIREPRTFLWGFGVHSAEWGREAHLREVRDSLAIFLNDATALREERIGIGSSSGWTSYYESETVDQFRSIEQAWFQQIDTQMAGRVLSRDYRVQTKNEFITLVRDIAVRRKIVDELKRSADRIREEFAYSHSLLVHWQAKFIRGTTEKYVRRRYHMGAFQVRITRPFFPYEFCFRDQFFRDRASTGVEEAVRFGADEKDFDELIDEFVRMSDVSRFEQRFAMAVQSAARLDWSRAEMLARHAIEAPRVWQVPRADAWYLRAIMARRTARTLKEYDEAFECVTEAIRQSEKFVTGKGGVDPRFYRERAACGFERENFLLREGERTEDEDVALVDSAFEDLRKAISAYGKDDLGVLHCLRIGCSLYFDFDGLRNKSKSRELCERFGAKVEEADLEPSIMSVRFWDTYLQVVKHWGWKIVGEDKVREFLSGVDLSNAPEVEFEIYGERLREFMEFSK